MRIGLIIYGSLATQSGGYLYDRKMVEHMRSCGDQVVVISIPWRSYPHHLSDNFSRGWARRLFEATQNLNILIQDELNHPSLFWINRRLRYQSDVPLVSLVHHLRVSETSSPLLRFLYAAVERAYLSTVDGYIFNSQTTRSSVAHLLKRNPPGVVAYPAADHLLPVPSTVVCSQPQAVAEAHEDKHLRLLFVGNLSRRKGLASVLHALARLVDLDIYLDVVGSLESEPRYVAGIRQQLVRAQLENRVCLHGAVTAAALKNFYAQADLFVMPSYEGFGIVYLEAMGYGLPVIASTRGAAHEIVNHGENGFLIDAGDVLALVQTIRSLYADREQLQELSSRARRRFEQQPTWEESMSRVRSWIEEVVNGDCSKRQRA